MNLDQLMIRMAMRGMFQELFFLLAFPIGHKLHGKNVKLNKLVEPATSLFLVITS